MNKLFFTIALTVLAFTLSNSQTKNEVIKTISISESVVNWKGSMLFSFGGHYGTVNFKDGTLKFNSGKLTGGTFIVDMTTMVNTDGGFNEGLMDHLKNEDFFNVPKYPSATFVITEIEELKDGNLRITGDLTIKGMTKSVFAEAKLDKTNNKFETRLKIDRTDWDIVYGAKGHVNIKDYAISDAIELEVEIQY
ncbi:YceI family protein [Aegicerativicinus sediminis]|uniref:YceI family protein n=1 Tax=Aegicerativicinus sediminis TaxID=2893202 RepID=UPI001E5B2E48|nr:YceI family protein [Aegicerativicinus sediminis]